MTEAGKKRYVDPSRPESKQSAREHIDRLKRTANNIAKRYEEHNKRNEQLKRTVENASRIHELGKIEENKAKKVSKIYEFGKKEENKRGKTGPKTSPEISNEKILDLFKRPHI